jgi:hypothetical protein
VKIHISVPRPRASTQPGESTAQKHRHTVASSLHIDLCSMFSFLLSKKFYTLMNLNDIFLLTLNFNNARLLIEIYDTGKDKELLFMDW